MSRRVLIVDTSILCCYLQIPGKDTAGAADDLWTHKRVADVLDREGTANSTFVLPLATILETGNLISQAPTNRYTLAASLAEIIQQVANATSPWAPFLDQSSLWGPEALARLAETWPDLAKGGTSIGDATIKDVAEYYAGAGFEVEIITADAQLKAYQPAAPAQIPRRRYSR